MRGDCPVGGVKVTGYATPAATYCAITGGTYAVTGNSGAEDEQGTCTFVDGSQCDAWDYYNGKCASEAAAATTTTEAPAAATARIPLVDALDTLEPQDVWQNFYDLTQIPRPSHHEEQVRGFLVQFGQGLGLETVVDDAGNVIIRKPASPGMENRQGVILQAHMDMVPQKTPESDHDFLTDPIDAYVEGEWVMADGTTLGADDGSGVAIAMAILQSDTLALGPIEALFTVNEEDGMDGASGLPPEGDLRQPGVLQGDTLINLDSEEVGVFTIGSAGGEYLNVQAPYAEAPLPSDVTAYTMTVSGLQGGHSGVDINLGLGHATKLLVRLLDQVVADQGVRVARLSGGTAANAIPREADALVVVPAAQVDAFLQAVQAFEATVQSELAATEPGLTVQATPIELPEVVMDEAAQKTLIAALYGSPQGVLRMSDTVPDLVETSVNMGIVNAADGQLAVTWLSRSSVDSEVVDVRRMLSSVWELAGIEPVPSGTYSGWAPNPDSPILLLMEDVYKNMYGEDPEVSAIHAGLECGTIAAKYPGMDAISIGPTLQKVHTPDERMEIASVKKLNDFLIETLQRISESTAGPTAIPSQTSSEATIQPLSMEVCDGQAQAMAALDVLEVRSRSASERSAGAWDGLRGNGHGHRRAVREPGCACERAGQHARRAGLDARPDARGRRPDRGRHGLPQGGSDLLGLRAVAAGCRHAMPGGPADLGVRSAASAPGLHRDPQLRRGNPAGRNPRRAGDGQPRVGELRGARRDAEHRRARRPGSVRRLHLRGQPAVRGVGAAAGRLPRRRGQGHRVRHTRGALLCHHRRRVRHHRGERRRPGAGHVHLQERRDVRRLGLL
jgi:dipeptidase D